MNRPPRRSPSPRTSRRTGAGWPRAAACGRSGRRGWRAPRRRRPPPALGGAAHGATLEGGREGHAHGQEARVHERRREHRREDGPAVAEDGGGGELGRSRVDDRRHHDRRAQIPPERAGDHPERDPDCRSWQEEWQSGAYPVAEGPWAGHLGSLRSATSIAPWTPRAHRRCTTGPVGPSRCAGFWTPSTTASSRTTSSRPSFRAESTRSTATTSRPGGSRSSGGPGATATSWAATRAWSPITATSVSAPRLTTAS